MSSIRVRIATLADANSIYELNKSVLPIYYSSIEHGMMIMNPTKLVLIAEINKKIPIGYLIGDYWTNGENFHIVSIGVNKDIRKKGIGSFLLKKLIDKLKRMGYKTITLNVHEENKVAYKFYEKHGFVVKERLKDYYDGCLTSDNLDAFNMIKNIKESDNPQQESQQNKP